MLMQQQPQQQQHQQQPNQLQHTQLQQPPQQQQLPKAPQIVTQVVSHHPSIMELYGIKSRPLNAGVILLLCISPNVSGFHVIYP